jgi:YesN/AraC family two-component response regulator
MADDAFDRYVRQSMMVNFDQFIEPLQSLPRKISEPTKHGNSIVGAIDKEVLIQALEQESLLSVEEEFERVISTAHAEDVSSWIEAIAQYIENNFSPMRLIDLQAALPLSMVEIWLGLLLGDFKLEQRGEFYNSSEIWIA